MSYNKQVRRVLRFGHFNHRGCVISITENGYQLHGKFYETKEEIDKAIDEDIERLKMSLNRIKPIGVR